MNSDREGRVTVGVRAHARWLPLATLAALLILLVIGVVVGVSGNKTALPLETQSLPGLRVVRTLPVTHERILFPNLIAGADHLTWSPDGQRLAAYTLAGSRIASWSPDGAVHQEIARYDSGALTSANILGFVSGHREVLAGPAAKSRAEQPGYKNDVAMSVLNAETGEIVKSVRGLKPQGVWQENIVMKAAISPDQMLVAVAYDTDFDRSIERRIGIYATDDWRLTKLLHFGGEDSLFGARALAFSPDGAELAIGYEKTPMRAQPHSYVDIVDVGSWSVKKTIGVFLEDTPPIYMPMGPSYRSAFISHVSFNHDGTMIVVGSAKGGTFWRFPNGQFAPAGSGNPSTEYPFDPIRVFRVSDGARVNSANGSFVGGPSTQYDMAWSPRQNLIAFQDLDHVLYLWDPARSGAPQAKQKLEKATTAIVFSPDGKLLGQAFGEGVRLFEIEN